MCVCARVLCMWVWFVYVCCVCVYVYTCVLFCLRACVKLRAVWRKQSRDNGQLTKSVSSRKTTTSIITTNHSLSHIDDSERERQTKHDPRKQNVTLTPPPHAPACHVHFTRTARATRPPLPAGHVTGQWRLMAAFLLHPMPSPTDGNFSCFKFLLRRLTIHVFLTTLILRSDEVTNESLITTYPLMSLLSRLTVLVFPSVSIPRYA